MGVNGQARLFALTPCVPLSRGAGEGERAAPLSHAVGEGLGVRAKKSASVLHAANPSAVPLSANDLPLWKTVYDHFRRWQRRGVLAQVRDTLVEQARAQAGKAALKYLAVDSPSVPSTAKRGHAGMTGARR